MCLKLFAVLRVYEIKRQTQAALGKVAYQRIFRQIADATEQPGETTVNKIINGEIVGKRLPDAASSSTSERNQDPAICPHPPISMKARGNKTYKWWTCLNCLSRWERKSLSEATTQGATTDSEKVLFGKFAGKTFLEIFKDAPQYAQWVLMTAENEVECSTQLKRLAQYLVKKEAEMVDHIETVAAGTDSDISSGWEETPVNMDQR